jgi:hypothetical protein
MSVSRRSLALLLMFGCGIGFAADEETPGVEFLEYLGIWEGSDEEWLIFSESSSDDVLLKAIENDATRRSGPIPEGEAPPETDDEN